jgi:DNA-binding LacI/PurR family transcriptional regulator
MRRTAVRYGGDGTARSGYELQTERLHSTAVTAVLVLNGHLALGVLGNLYDAGRSFLHDSDGEGA